MFDQDNVLVVYTRKQAIEDGILVDVSKTAQEAGFKIPVAVTETLFQKYLEPSSKLVDQGQSLEGRLWDMLFLLYLSSRKCDAQRIMFKVFFLMEPNSNPEKAELKALIGPGDQGEPVITVMLPDED